MPKGAQRSPRILTHRSIAVRFCLFVCTLVFLMGMSAIAAVGSIGELHMRDSIRREIEGLGSGYGIAIGRVVQGGDLDAAQRMVNSMAAVPGMRDVRAEGVDGKFLARASGSTGAGPPAERFDLPLIAPGGVVVGRLKYEVSESPMPPPPFTAVWPILIGLIALMGLSVPLTIFFVRRITAPLRQLTDFAETVNANRLAIQVDIKTGDEFETLARAFNHMVARLDTSMRRVQRLAFVDAATELPNADRLQHDLRGAIAGAQRGGAPGALFLLQLDRLQRVGETLGAEAAHEVLTGATARLRTAVSAAGAEAGGAPMVARLSAEEFAILFATLPKTVDLRGIANAIAQPFDQSLEWREHKIALSAILGAAFFPRDGETPEEILRHARLALKAARETPLRMRFFSRSLDRAAAARLNLEKEMRAALDQNQFRAFFQPKIDLRSGRIVGAEALARWVRPDRSVISPAKFIPAAEEMGLICPVSESILRDACWKAAAWSREGLCARVAVNVSALQFADEDFPDKVLTILNQAGLPPQCLELEITESMAMEDVDRAIRMIEPLRAQGVRFAIDDFGTGHSSLASLTRLPFDVLKIDQTFIRGLSKDGHAPALVETILAMAAALNYDAVAEGVETDEEAEFLRRRGCPVAQGFLYSAALPPAEYHRILRQGSILAQRAGATPALDPVA